MQTTSYKLNVTPGGVPLTIHISQYDVGLRQYTFQPYTTVGEFSYVSGATVTLEATKPDGYAVIHNCTYNQDGSITYTVQEQLAAKAGRVWSKVVIRNGDDVLGTGAVVWMVDNAGVKDNAIISDSDVSALQQWMDDVEDYAEQADGSAQSAASSASLAESAATQAAGYVDQAVILGGTPLVAATVSAMSNHDRVYVYTGSETGYTAGNWYYWNGSAWTSGGIYNSSAVQTDPTLSVSGMAADAAATGELKNAITYEQSKYLILEQGYWGIANGVKTASNNWCRTAGYIPAGFIYRTTTTVMLPQAFEQNGTYVGTWNGTAFTKTVAATGRYKVVDTTDWMSRFPSYKFTLTFYRGGSAFTPTTLYDELEIDFVSDTIYKSLGYKTATFSSTGTAHSSTEDTIVLPIAEGESFYFRLNADIPLTGNGAALYAIYLDGTNESIQEKAESNKVYAYTAKKNIASFGVYVAAQSSSYTVSFTMADKTSLYALYYSDFVSSEYNDESITTKLTAYADICTANAEADAFLFFTDPHIFPYAVDEYRMERVFGTLQQTFNNSSAQFVLCGGDWLTEDDTAAEAAYKLGRINGITRAKFGEAYYPIIGNHDSNEQGVSELSQNSLTLLMFAKYGKMYYQFNTPNTRYYVFDTGSDHVASMTAYRWTQVNWYATELAQNDDAHSVIALHIFSGQTNENSFASDPKVQTFADNITKVAQAYNNRSSITLNGITYDFTGKTGKVAYLISGHTHYDADMVQNGIPCIVTTTASYAPNFDLCYADYTNGKFKTVRVGSGENRTIDIII